MHAHLQEVLSSLDASRTALREAVASVPAAARDKRPAADRWSAIDVLEHLALAEERFLGFVAKAIDSARAAGLAQETGARVPVSEKVAGAMADRTNRRNAPEMLHPKGGIDERQAWAALDRSRETFRSALIAADGLALGSVVQDHPVFGPLTVYQWAEVVARHELRHVDQIREVAAQFT
jgi:hypothetical protein